MRFPQFTGEWETVSLDDICDKIGDGIHSTPQYDENGDYFFINGNNFVEGTIQISETTKRVTKKEAEQHNIKHLTGNTILISINGTIGNLALYNNEPVMLGKSACYINPQKREDRLFIFYQLGSKRVCNYFVSELTGSTIKNLSLKSIRQTAFHLPSIEEQNKISSLLFLIDRRISTQSKIIKELETLIKGIADSLFGDTRYSFERSLLSMLCQIKKGEQINGLKLSVSGDYYVMNGGIVPSGYHTACNSEADTISISEGGNSCGYVQYNSSRFWSGGHCYTLNDVSPEVLNKYLYYYLKNQEKKIMELRAGSGLPNIQKKELDRFEIRYPSPEKQKDIVRILDVMSDKIETERNLLSAFQKQKKYLLKQMFI